MSLNIKTDTDKYKQHPYYEKPVKRDRKIIQRVLRRELKARLKGI